MSSLVTLRQLITGVSLLLAFQAKAKEKLKIC